MSAIAASNAPSKSASIVLLVKLSDPLLAYQTTSSSSKDTVTISRSPSSSRSATETPLGLSILPSIERSVKLAAPSFSNQSNSSLLSSEVTISISPSSSRSTAKGRKPASETIVFLVKDSKPLFSYHTSTSSV